MTGKKDLNNLRDCVRLALKNGSQRGSEFKTMRHAIIVELKRIGYTNSEVKDILLDWNQRCEKILPPNEQKRQLLDYVDWVAKLESRNQKLRVGCRALEDYCIGEESCLFSKKKLYLNKKATEVAPFDFNEAREFLETRYKGAEGYVMFLILKNLRRYQLEKGIGEVIYIGYKTISNLIREHDGHILDTMTVHRRINDLISEEMLEIIVKGKKGSFSNEANGYRILEWKQSNSNNNSTNNSY